MKGSRLKRSRPSPFALLLLFTALSLPAAAQERPAAMADFSAGWMGFADDGVVTEGFVSGDARWYLSPRVSVGPEIVYVFGENHSHLIATGDVTWDILRDQNGTRRVMPFLVAGGGVFQTRESFFNDTFTSSEGAFTAGGGLRARVGSRATVGIDARVGWEMHLRIGATIGLQLGQR